MRLEDLVTDLDAERAYVDGILEGISTEDWKRPTPAEGWNVQDQIWHLAYFDVSAARSMEDPDAFRAHAEAADATVHEYLAGVEEQGRRITGAEAYAAWMEGRRRFNAAVAHAPEGRVPWYGVAMAPPSLVTARIMETWAHGVDVADTFGVPVSDSERVAHVVFLGWRAIPFTYGIRNMALPDKGIRVEVTTSAGTPVVLGPEDASGTVRGSALELALVAVQRRNWRDTSLEVSGSALDWIEVAQAFAGPPGPGRPPSS